MYLATLNGGLGKASAKTSGKTAGKTSAKRLREIKQIYEEGRRRYKDREQETAGRSGYPWRHPVH